MSPAAMAHEERLLAVYEDVREEELDLDQLDTLLRRLESTHASSRVDLPALAQVRRELEEWKASNLRDRDGVDAELAAVRGQRTH